MLQITKIHERTDKFVAILSNTDMMSEKPVHLLVDEQQMEELILYKSGYGCIQDVLIHFDPFEREFVKTGYGPHSQELLFGVTYAPKEKVVCLVSAFSGFTDVEKATYFLHREAYRRKQHTLVLS